MGFFDWNDNGEDDLFDDMMDYHIYKDICEEEDDDYDEEEDDDDYEDEEEDDDDEEDEEDDDEDEEDDDEEDEEENIYEYTISVDVIFGDEEESTDDTDNVDTTCNIVEFPNYDTLKEDIEKLRTELSMLMLEHDELKYTICVNLETQYMYEFGALEYRLYEAQCAILRLKRKIELVQMKINRQEKIVIDDIEQELDKEFEKYIDELNEQMTKMNQVLDRLELDTLSKEESKELKAAYRKIVKALHPDMNMDVTEEQLRMLERAIEAYKNGDLATIRLIADMVGEPILPDIKEDRIQFLIKEKERFTENIKKIQVAIEEIKEEFPYTEKELLNNEDGIKERKELLKENIACNEKQIELYKNKLEEMIGGI